MLNAEARYVVANAMYEAAAKSDPDASIASVTNLIDDFIWGAENGNNDFVQDAIEIKTCKAGMIYDPDGQRFFLMKRVKEYK